MLEFIPFPADDSAKELVQNAIKYKCIKSYQYNSGRKIQNGLWAKEWIWIMMPLSNDFPWTHFDHMMQPHFNC
jgi:hypothetical protein